jgi:hypothetical protein
MDAALTPPTTGDNMARFIGKCKKCKTVLVTDAHVQSESVGVDRFGTARARAAYVLHTGEKVRRNEYTGKVSHFAPCWGCTAKTSCHSSYDNVWVELTLIVGTVTAKPCDARCISATGHKCECACGGENHGGGHFGVLTVAAAA